MRLETPKWSDVPAIWPKIEPWIISALDHGGGLMTLRDVYQGLLGRNMKLWLAVDGDEVKACCITQITMYSAERHLTLLIAGADAGAGGLDEWPAFHDVLENYAKVLECEAMEFIGRAGWKRRVKELGYEPTAIYYRKRIV